MIDWSILKPILQKRHITHLAFNGRNLMKPTVQHVLSLLSLLISFNGFSQNPDIQGNNIQNPELRKEITQLREKVNQSKAVWKFIGYSEKNKIRSDLFFYDSSSVEKLENGIYRVWIKDAKMTMIKLFEKDSEIIDKAAHIESEGYVPSCVKVQNLKFDNKHDIIIYESIAQLKQPKPSTATLIEIDLKSKNYRTLSVSVYKPNGDIVSETNLTLWHYTGTGTNFETLYKILKSEE